jgi:hypothetical protein
MTITAVWEPLPVLDPAPVSTGYRALGEKILLYRCSIER